MIFVADANNERIREISFNPQARLVTPPNLGIATYAGLTLTGLVGRTYQIQISPNMTKLDNTRDTASQFQSLPMV